MSESKTTTDHDTIRSWAEARGAQPVTVSGTAHGDDAGVIRLNFPGYDEDKLEPISWDEWFEKFDESNLALLYQEETAGGEQSNFNKLVSREGHREGEKPAAKKPARKTTAKAEGKDDRKPAAKTVKAKAADKADDEKKAAPGKTAAKAADKKPAAKSETKAAGAKASKPAAKAAAKPAAKKKAASA